MNQFVKVAGVFVALASVGISGTALAAPGDVAELRDGAAAPIPTLSRSQAKEILEAIDQQCGDTWCEGDFNWSFNKIKCDFGKGECKLSIELIDTDTGEEKKRYPRKVVVKGFHSFSEMVEVLHGGAGNRRFVVLRDTFSDKLNDAFNAAEVSVRAEMDSNQ